MSRTVHRFRVAAGAEITVPVGDDPGGHPPVGSVLWAKSREHGTVDFWMIVDPDLAGAPDLPPARRFTATGTGRYVPDGAVYCDSTEDATGSMAIWHLWEICAHDYAPLGDAPRWCQPCWPEG